MAEIRALSNAEVLVNSTTVWMLRCDSCRVKPKWPGTCKDCEKLAPDVDTILRRACAFTPVQVSDLVALFVNYEQYPEDFEDCPLTLITILGGGPSARVSWVRGLDHKNPALTLRCALMGDTGIVRWLLGRGYPLPRVDADAGWSLVTEIGTLDLESVGTCVLTLIHEYGMPLTDPWLRLLVFLMAHVPWMEIEVSLAVAIRDRPWPLGVLEDLTQHLPAFRSRPDHPIEIAWTNRVPAVRALVFRHGLPKPDLGPAARKILNLSGRASEYLSFQVLDFLVETYGSTVICDDLALACLVTRDLRALEYLRRWNRLTTDMVDRFVNRYVASAKDGTVLLECTNVLMFAASAGVATTKHRAALKEAVRSLK